MSTTVLVFCTSLVCTAMSTSKGEQYHYQCPSSTGCLKYVHDVAQTCDDGWCIAHGGASWFDYGFVGNIRCARMHVWFCIAIDGVHCVIARDVRDALDGKMCALDAGFTVC